MAALSPRSTNIPLKTELRTRRELIETKPIVPRKELTEAKPAAPRVLRGEKDHPPPPPAIVYEPDDPDGRPGERYHMGDYLGKGGFAICYQGQVKREEDEEWIAPRLFALKIVKAAMPQPKLADKVSADTLLPIAPLLIHGSNQFKTELQIHSKMHHPYIVEFHRAFTYSECTFVVLEYCRNGSLMDMVRKRGHLKEPEVRRYVIQICGAIKYMHFKNVLHRDLKMGNIFLDGEMNVKVGDFGLAALLLSNSEYSLNRRRTMCGTPNYIAPEVLAKGSKGHDHKVDIWSLGIIMYVAWQGLDTVARFIANCCRFAMLTGAPPFQSKTQEEIYRKVEARSYLWPSMETCPNDISQNAKELVASMLVEASERPEPDDIVSHPFFKSGLIPEMVSPLAKISVPRLSGWSAKMGVNEETWYQEQWSKFCRKCGVGRIDATQTFPLVGKGLHKSTYKECVLEERLGLTPTVPLPADMIYRPLTASQNEDKIQVLRAAGKIPGKDFMAPTFPASPIKDVSPKTKKVLLRTLSADNVPKASTYRATQIAPKRQNFKSFAAELRERDLPKKYDVAERSREAARRSAQVEAQRLLPSCEGLFEPAPPRPLDEGAIRQTSKAPNAPELTKQSASGRLTRSQTFQNQPNQIPSKDRVPQQSALKKSASSNEFGQAPSGETVVHRETDREANDGQDKGKYKVSLAPVDEGTGTGDGRQYMPSAARKQPSLDAPNGTKPQLPEATLIDPAESAELVVCTKAREVQLRLSMMLDSLRTALNRKQPNKRAAPKRTKTMPVVVKWVDYSNKFGIGYTLDDGSIGCLLNAEGKGPSSGVLARGNVEESNREEGTPKASVPLQGQPIEFYENYLEDGFKRVRLEEDQYQVYFASEDDIKKIRPGLSGHATRKRRAVLLWTKFANYMRDALAKGQNSQPEESGDKANNEGSKQGSGPCVLFYQRLGNVGVWAFGDGSFQVRLHF